MFRKTLLTVAMFAAATAAASAADLPVKAAPTPPAPPPFFFVNDNSISYHYEFTANNPGAGTTPKNVLSYTHFDVWAYGTNFFNVDWLKATNGTTTPTATGTEGYTEIYGFFRSTFGWNQIFNTKQFAIGPLTNVEFVIGADLNTDNTALGSAKRSIEGGLQFDFATPYKGFFNVDVVAYHEWQHDGFAAAPANPSGAVNFNTTWGVEALWVQPLGFLPPAIPLTFKSLLVVHGPKGCGEACGGSAPGASGLTRGTEYLTQQTLSLDVGKMATGKAGMFSVWTGYRWWKNKFGILPNQPTGAFPFTVESTWLTGATMAF